MQWIDNASHILNFLFNHASRKYHEVWASHIPFLHSFKDTVPPSEACLYGCSNLNLVQVQPQPLSGMSQFSASM